MQKVQLKNASIQLIAYKKVIFHCLRYSSHKVYGVLTSHKNNPNKITNAYPLFHTSIVNPSFCTALDLIESNLGQNEQIVGFYEFIESGDSAINKIIETNTALKTMRVLRIWVTQDKQIKLGMSGYDLQYPKFNDIKNDILQGKHNLIVDFDAHFEEIQLDFTNQYVK